MDFNEGYDGGIFVCDESEGIFREVETIISIEENGQINFNEWNW